MSNEDTERDTYASLERRGRSRTGDASRNNDLNGQAVTNEEAMNSVRLDRATWTRLYVRIRIKASFLRLIKNKRKPGILREQSARPIIPSQAQWSKVRARDSINSIFAKQSC